MCKKHTGVSHSSTQAEIISLDAGLRIDGTPSLDLWALIIEVLHSDSDREQKLKPERKTRLQIKHQLRNSPTRTILFNYRVLILFPQTRSVT